MPDPTPAAGPWLDGEPEERGRYLVEYEQHGQRRVFVADYDLHRAGDSLEWDWSGMLDAEVLRYAEINSEYV